MGIPYYFKNITQSHPNIIKHDIINTTNRLFLDFNCGIHRCAQELLSVSKISTDHDIDIFEDKLITKSIDYIKYIVNIIKPIDLIYISIDGVAPFTKMFQQRKRRYLSVWRNEMNGVENKWTSNCISPGTQFMKKLNIALSSFKDIYINEIECNNIIVSDSSEPGEGEFKIFNYINNHKFDMSYTDVIYGLDADLIMLSILSFNTRKFLLREFDIYEKNTQYKDSFIFLDISELSNQICLTMKQYKYFQKYEDDKKYFQKYKDT